MIVKNKANFVEKHPIIGYTLVIIKQKEVFSMIGLLKYSRYDLLNQIFIWILKIMPLYQHYVPNYLRRRRNVNQSKLTDIQVIALMCWQVELKMTVQTRFYSFLRKCVFINGQLPERSRFNRICNRDGLIIQVIRYHLIHDKVQPKFTIIDSLPMPLCKPIRNFRAKIFNGLANNGYNSTKKMYYYGFKGSFEVDGNSGIVMAYTLTEASLHDIKMVKTLVNQYPCRKILADEGYISKRLKFELDKLGIWFWTPKRKDMKPYHYNDRFLRRLCRRIETVFSGLESLFNIENNRGRSLAGFQTRLEQCLLVDTLRKIN